MRELLNTNIKGVKKRFTQWEIAVWKIISKQHCCILGRLLDVPLMSALGSYYPGSANVLKMQQCTSKWS